MVKFGSVVTLSIAYLSLSQTGLTATQRLSNADIPVTIYSESVAFNKYEGKFQGTRALANTIPFNKQTNFTKPMNEYSKVVEDE